MFGLFAQGYEPKLWHLAVFWLVFVIVLVTLQWRSYRAERRKIQRRIDDMKFARKLFEERMK